MVLPPTMTLHECAEAFRANQISIGENTLADGIAQGRFPFAVCIEGTRRNFLIFRGAFYRWLEEMMQRDEVIQI